MHDRRKELLTLFVGLLVLTALMLTVVSTPNAYAANYNRLAAVAYADAWAHSRNPSYRSYGNDCANFASQIMAAGGLPQRGWNRWDSYHWFYNSNYNSNTWSATDWMNQYFSNYQGSDFQYSGADQLEAGDVLLMQLCCGIPSHGRVIVGWGYSEEGEWSSPGSWGLLANQHTSDRKRILWWDPIPAGTPLWAWHVIW